MQTKVKYKAVDLRGNVVTKVVKVEHPEFKEINREVELNFSGTLRKVPYHKSVNEQVIDWLDNQDKIELMYDNDWHCILTYDVHVPKPKVDKRKKVFELVEELFDTEVLRASFVLTYVRLYKNIKSLSVEAQVKTVLESLGLAVQAQTYVSKRFLAILQGEDPDKVTMLNQEEDNLTKLS
jgi:hypothetical protein